METKENDLADALDEDATKSHTEGRVERLGPAGPDGRHEEFPSGLPKSDRREDAEDVGLAILYAQHRGMEQIMRLRGLATWVAGTVALLLLAALPVTILWGPELPGPALVALIAGVFASFIVIFGVMISGLFRSSSPELSQHPTMSIVRDILGKSHDS